MSGSDSIYDLHEAVQSWWKPWADKEGYVKYNYSYQFRYKVDQIGLLIRGICKHPQSRRNVITTWDTGHAHAIDCLITNCHGTVIQAFVGSNNDPKSLHLVTYQRSADVVCGLPHNWFQYWAFLIWLAHWTGTNAGTLQWIGGDIHLYEAHYSLAREIIQQWPSDDAPNLIYKPTSEDFKADDFSLDRDYKPKLTTKAEMVV